jgi:Mg-chelatase subunit ChlD
MQNLRNRNKSSRGVAIVLTTLSLSVTLPLVGLGFDVTTLYLIKSKLGAAADSAALAGARALAQGSTEAAQEANAQSTAQTFFSGNFPTGYWHSSAASATVSVNSTSTPNYRTVIVNATVQAPLYFLRIFNQQSSTINIMSQAGRRDVMMMLVLDRSNSMNQIVAGTGLSACTIMRTDAAQFVNNFAPGRDQIGLVVFSGSTYVYPPTINFTTPDANGNTIPSLISNIVCDGSTSTAEALYWAYHWIQNVNSTTRSNVVMLMTDGLPTGVTGNFINYRQKPNSCDSSGAAFYGVYGGGLSNGSMFPGAALGISVDTQPTLANAGDVAISNDTGCVFAGNEWKAYEDLTQLPSTDYFGNSTVGNYTVQSPSYGSATNLNDLQNAQGAVYAAINAADNQATAIRTNAVLKPTIYTIGLAGDGAVDQQPDPLLLMKMANDPNMVGVNSTGLSFYNQQLGQPQGLFANAPDASQLAVAFDTIARQISIRLSQ